MPLKPDDCYIGRLAVNRQTGEPVSIASDVTDFDGKPCVVCKVVSHANKLGAAQLVALDALDERSKTE